VSTLSDRFGQPAHGYAGGRPGARSGFRTSTGDRRRPTLSMAMPAGATLRLQLPGGGGHFPPSDPAPGAVPPGVGEGLVSPAAASREYGFEVTSRGRRSGLNRTTSGGDR